MNERPILRQLLALLLVMALVAGACASGTRSGEDEGSATTAPPDTMAPTEGLMTQEAPAAAGTDALQNRQIDFGDGAVDPVVVVPQAFGRDIIYVATIAVSVNDVADASREATSIIQGLGGYVFGQQTSGGTNPVSVLTFKVLPEDFQTALDRLGSIGDIRSQTVSTDDVTERIVDLESRILTAEASVARLQAFLAEATDINTITNLEKQLLERETQLETLRGQLRTLEGQVELATITVTISQKHSAPSIDLFVTAYEGHNTGLSCPAGELFRIEQETPMTLCFEVINTGDTTLADVELFDSALGVDLSELTLVSGDPTVPLESGDSFTMAYELTPTENVRLVTNVTGVPVDEAGEPIGGRPVGDTDSLIITTFEPEGIPSFVDGLQAGWAVLLSGLLYVVLILGATLPFLIPAVLLWLVWRRWSNRRPGPIPAAPADDIDEEVGDLVDA